MLAITLSGRLSAVALFVVLPASLLAQPFSSRSEPSTEFAIPAPANLASSVFLQKLPPTEEERADAFMIHKEYQAAIDAYSRIGQPSPTVWNKMGIAYQMLFDQKNAARCYKECLKIEPYNPHALNNLATIEDSQRDFAAAERLYRRALELSPSSARLVKNIATNLLLQHKYRESTEFYAQALAIDPKILDRDEAGPTTTAPGSMRDRGELSYLEARSCARAGLIDCALSHLRRAFDEGFATRQKVAKEDDFGTLRLTPGYERLIKEQR